MSNFVNLMDIIYPVGSIYQSMNATSPASSIGGTWTRLNTFLYGSTTAKNTGGEATHTLSLNEMPAHSHNGSTGEAGKHNHSIDGRIIAWYGPGGGNVLQGAGNYLVLLVALVDSIRLRLVTIPTLLLLMGGASTQQLATLHNLLYLVSHSVASNLNLSEVAYV